MEWWIWVLIGFVVWRAMGRGCAFRPRRLHGWNAKRLTGRDAEREPDSHRRRPELLKQHGLEPDGYPASGGGGAEREPAGERDETPEERLQRRFAEGHISMEQYERELDELLGLRG